MNRPKSFRGSIGLVDHPEREPVRDVADQDAADRQQPPRMEDDLGEDRRRDADREAEEEAEVDDEAELLLPDLEEDPVAQLGLLLHPPDHHQLHVEQLLDVVAHLVHDLADERRQLLLHPLVDGLAEPRRQVVPHPRVLALHDPLDDVADVAAHALEHVLDDPLLVELLVEVGRRAELRDPLVDRDRAHLRGARRDDPLPPDTALHDAGDLLYPARQEVRERREARKPDAP